MEIEIVKKRIRDNAKEYLARKEYYKKYADDHKEHKKEYQKNNAEHIKTYRNKESLCACGKYVSQHSKYQHVLSKYHITHTGMA